MRLIDLPSTPYRDAWRLQEELHAQVLDGADEALILLEHPPVITFGRRVADAQRNLLAPPALLAQLGVEVVESDRGGDITYHGPGQLVAYPIVRIADHGWSVGAYVHRLERIVIDALADFGVPAFTDPSAVGVWVAQRHPTSPKDPPPTPGLSAGSDSAQSAAPDPIARQDPHAAKICALGVRIKRGVSLHGLALNLTTDLAHFDLINPCGLSRPVTSLHQLLGDAAPAMPELKKSLARHALAAFALP